MTKSLALSFVALFVVTLLLEAPAKFLTATSDAVHYFLIGTLFSGLRILALGVVVGHLYGKLGEHTRT